MDERGNMRLLLCDGLLAERPYQDLYVDTWWENSALRKWLNGVFVKECFAPEEGRNILNVRVETPASEEYYTNGGNRTMDRVFVHSKAEVLQYLPEVEDRNLGHLVVDAHARFQPADHRDRLYRWHVLQRRRKRKFA